MNSLALIGMSKNSGKTTVLNVLLELLEQRGITTGLSSIGRDGESVDIVTDTPKPHIYIRRGTLFTTTAVLLPECDATTEILDLPGIGTPLGEVVVARALSDGYIQLSGPSMNVQTVSVNRILKQLGAELCIVDGALSRKSFASPSVTDAVILSAGAALDKDIRAVAERTKFTCYLLMLDEFNDNILRSPFECSETVLLADSEKNITDTGLTGAFSPETLELTGDTRAAFFPGVITDGLATRLIKRGCKNMTLVVRDASKLFLHPDTFARLLRKNCQIFVMRKTQLLGVTVNPVSPYGYRFDPDEFLSLMKSCLPVPVVDVMRGDLHDIFS